MILTFEEYAKKVQQWYEKAEKWDNVTHEDNPHGGICNVEVNRALEQENKQLRDNLSKVNIAYMELEQKLEKIRDFALRNQLAELEHILESKK